MMKIYKVQQEKLSFDWGRFEGYVEIGYYTTKERAEQVKEETLAETKGDICRGEVKIIEIEVND